MSRPTETQAAVFFGILASALIFTLTAMALASMGASPRHHPHFSAEVVQDASLGAADSQ